MAEKEISKQELYEELEILKERKEHANTLMNIKTQSSDK